MSAMTCLPDVSPRVEAQTSAVSTCPPSPIVTAVPGARATPPSTEDIPVLSSLDTTTPLSIWPASAFANCCAICSLRKANCRLRSCPTGKEMRFKMKRAQKLSPPPPLHKFRQPVRLPVRLPAHPPPTHFPSVSPSIRPPTNFPSVIFSVRRCTHACTRTGDHHQRICCYSGALENSHL